MSPTYYGGGTGTSISTPTTDAFGNANAPSTPVEAFRKEFEYHPFHFWGVSGASIPVLSSCNALVREYNWQNGDRAGRADIRSGLMTAEARLTSFLGYSPIPHYVIENLPFPHYYDARYSHTGYDAPDGRYLTVQAQEKSIIAAGSETLTFVGTAALVYSDEDGDGILESWTASIATTETEADNIAVYYRATDRLNGEGVSDRWRIAPVRISITGGIATATGKTWQVVRPILYEGFADESIDIAVTGNFATHLDIYTRKTVSGSTFDTAAAVLIWESSPYPYSNYLYPVTSSDPAAYAYALARVGVRDASNGILTIGEAVYDATAGTWAAVNDWYSCWKRPPDRMILRYYAGTNIPRAQNIINRLAACEIARPICACETANRAFYHWTFDLSRSSGNNDEAYSLISSENLNNPFGTQRGQVYAWRETKVLRKLTGFSV